MIHHIAFKFYYKWTINKSFIVIHNKIYILTIFKINKLYFIKQF